MPPTEMRRICFYSAIVVTCMTMIGANRSVSHQQTVLLKQLRDGAPAENLTAAELATLGDPFFNLVLKDDADVTRLSEIEDRLQPDAAKRQTFVVHESIADSTVGQSRRSVLAYAGRHKGEVLESNVMLSVFFDSQEFSNTPNAIEAWGWDTHRGRYNYYKLDASGNPESRLAWKFRGSSVGADLLTASERRNTCLACHINGAPVMKELVRPWNNWHSFDSPIRYLSPAHAAAWPVVQSSLLTPTRLSGAETLEGSIGPAIDQFNTRRINAALERRAADGNIALDADGMGRVIEGRRLLRHLFITTEYNIVSALQKSGMHPFARTSLTGPANAIRVPGSFFLNSGLIAGRARPPIKGLGIQNAREFDSLLTVSPSEYRQLIDNAGVMLGRTRGDADFAWFVPEASHVDISMVDRLIQRGIVTAHFVAAALAINLETPILSDARAALFTVMPDTFRFRATSGQQPPVPQPHPDELTREVIARLEGASPQPGTPQAEFLRRLKAPNPVDLLTADIGQYIARVKQRLNNPATRSIELARLHTLAIERRNAVLRDAVLRQLNESGDRLFPVP